MNVNRISKITDYMIMDEIFGDGSADKDELSENLKRKLDRDFEVQQRKAEKIYSNDRALANIAVLRNDGLIKRIFLTQEEADVIVRLMCLMAVYAEED